MESRIRSFHDLEVWKSGMALAKAIYDASHRLPKYETYALGDQLRRAAVSVPTNIAEGYMRGHRKEYLQFLAVSAGSHAELTTLLLLAKEIHQLPDSEELLSKADELGKMLAGLRRSLRITTAGP